MKSILPFILLIISALSIQAQDFELLVVDPEGDPSQSVADIKAVLWALDATQDTLLIKVQFHTSIAGDLGLLFGFDTDGDHLTGEDWMGPNNSLNPEFLFSINRNFIDPSFFYGESNMTLNYYTLEGEDDMEVIVHIARAQMPIFEDLEFNFIVGTGGFDITPSNRQTYDNAPDDTFLSINSTNAEEALAENSIRLFPNPAQDFAVITDDNLMGSWILVYDSTGKLIWTKKALYPEVVLPCQNWSKGAYYVQIKNEINVQYAKIIVH